MLEKLEWANAQRAKGLPTIPSTIEARPSAVEATQTLPCFKAWSEIFSSFRCQEELSYNPFLRCSDPALARWCGMPGAQPVQVLAELRKRKDSFGLVASVTTHVLSLLAYFPPALQRLGIQR